MNHQVIIHILLLRFRRENVSATFFMKDKIHERDTFNKEKVKLFPKNSHKSWTIDDKVTHYNQVIKLEIKSSD